MLYNLHPRRSRMIDQLSFVIPFTRNEARRVHLCHAVKAQYLRLTSVTQSLAQKHLQRSRQQVAAHSKQKSSRQRMRGINVSQKCVREEEGLTHQNRGNTLAGRKLQ